MQLRSERVLIETQQHHIEGLVTLPQEGYRSRLSDFLSAVDREFIAVRNASVSRIGEPDTAVSRDFIAVARRHVVLAAPLDTSEYLES